jgi:hypothetical protein
VKPSGRFDRSGLRLFAAAMAPRPRDSRRLGAASSAEEAAARNISKLKRLAELTEQFAQLIGTQSVSNVTCSPLGKVQLRKHGTPVPFAHRPLENQLARLASTLQRPGQVGPPGVTGGENRPKKLTHVPLHSVLRMHSPSQVSHFVVLHVVPIP